MSSFTQQTILGFVFLSAGCSLVVDTSTAQCSSNNDCSALAEGSICSDAGRCVLSSTQADEGLGEESGETGVPIPVDPRWACVGEPIEDTEETIVLTLDFRNILTAQAPENMWGRMCPLPDSTCSSPIAELQFGPDGLASLNLPAGLRGYVEFTADGINNSLVYIAPTYADEVRRIDVLSPVLIDASASQIGLTFNREERALMIAQVFDCDDLAAPGVEFELSNADEQTVLFYGQLPDNTVTETPDDGSGGFLNIPPGFGTWIARDAQSGLQLEELRFAHRAGWVSIIAYEAH